MHRPLTNIHLKLTAIVIIHTIILGWMVWDRVSLLRHGQEVTLSVEPVDPRDLLRGDYVILRYAISRIELQNIEADSDFKRRETVYVGLKKSDKGAWEAFSINHQLPRIKSDTVYIKGRVTYASRKGYQTPELRIKYGIEKYFVPEGEGRQLESLRNEKVLSVIVAVSQSGETGIKSLLVRGKPVYEETIF